MNGNKPDRPANGVPPRLTSGDFVARHARLLDILPLEPCHAICFTAECGDEITFSTASLSIAMACVSQEAYLANIPPTMHQIP
ncbi:MAG: hypothetical protein IPP18_00430 [Rhodocyclaceae bacterium]|nr:hypothetical protein [Rhodocyclaceae bacterium]MBK9953661.1 hypothetical protein [Rhodocyclaceae bacterium]